MFQNLREIMRRVPTGSSPVVAISVIDLFGPRYIVLMQF